MAYGSFKKLLRRTVSDKASHDKGFDIAKNPKNDGYQRELALIVYNFLKKNPLIHTTEQELILM